MLLDRMPPQLGALGSGLGRGLGERRDGFYRVAVLARVARQLVAAQLTGRPAAVERVAEHVPALPRLLDPAPSRCVKRSSSVQPMAKGRRIPARCDPSARHSRSAIPAGHKWVGEEPAAVERICARGPLLVHFVDVAHLSSVRTLPYLRAWAERYARPGADPGGGQLPPLSIHGRCAASWPRPLARLGVRLPRGRRLRLPRLARLRLRGVALAVPLGPRRGPALVPLRRGRVRRPPRRPSRRSFGASTPGSTCPSPSPRFAPATPPARSSRARATRCSRWVGVASRGGRARTTRRSSSSTRRAAPGRRVDGRGAAARLARRRAAATIEVEAPGAYELAAHERHEAHHLSLGATPGLSVYSVGFAAAVP